MSKITYKVVEHDGGWAYMVDGSYSETFRTREDAHDAAEAVAKEQRRGGEDGVIEYEDTKGHWTREAAKGDDRPETDVED